MSLESVLNAKFTTLKLILLIKFKQNKINMNTKILKPSRKSKIQLFRMIINKTFQPWGNPQNLTQAHLSKKADSPRKFWGEFSNLVGILLWIIVGLNLIITFLIYKIIF